ncbi:MAG: ExbD/TolR family protein [Pirellulales bacterium]
MRTPGSVTRGRVGFNMTPMIDVVFLLIIFFLVSSHLARQELQVALDLPEAETSRPITGPTETPRLTVNVLPDGRAVVGGRTLDGDALERLIQYESRRRRQPLEVRIRSDRRAPYAAVEPAMVACARAGVWRVTFAVVEQ